MISVYARAIAAKQSRIAAFILLPVISGIGEAATLFQAAEPAYFRAFASATRVTMEGLEYRSNETAGAMESGVAVATVAGNIASAVGYLDEREVIFKILGTAAFDTAVPLAIGNDAYSSVTFRHSIYFNVPDGDAAYLDLGFSVVGRLIPAANVIVTQLAHATDAATSVTHFIGDGFTYLTDRVALIPGQMSQIDLETTMSGIAGGGGMYDFSSTAHMALRVTEGVTVFGSSSGMLPIFVGSSQDPVFGVAISPTAVPEPSLSPIVLLFSFLPLACRRLLRR